MGLSIGDSIGPYEIVAPLGRGAMGEVYRARDNNLGRIVAIKVLPDALVQGPDRRARFKREAKVLAALNHPNIATVYEWEESSGSSALVMELIEGNTLDQSIPWNGMPIEAALKYAIQITRGLEAAHRAGIAHRDLKPSNIIITHGGNLKLLDFGLARPSATITAGSKEEIATATIGPTIEGHIAGTVAYMSPEQAQGKPLDARSDLFSFGVILFEILTGRRPFAGADPVSTLAAILHEEPRDVSTFVSAPPELDRVVSRCLRKSVERRFQTASDLRVALEELDEEITTGQLAAAPSVQRSRSASYWLLVSLIAFIALVAVLYFRGRQPTSAPGSLHQLTFESGMAVMPAISRDGKLLAYASDRAGGEGLELWIRLAATRSALLWLWAWSRILSSRPMEHMYCSSAGPRFLKSQH